MAAAASLSCSNPTSVSASVAAASSRLSRSISAVLKPPSPAPDSASVCQHGSPLQSVLWHVGLHLQGGAVNLAHMRKPGFTLAPTNVWGCCF